MAEGFSLELQDYCSHCEDFEPNVKKNVIVSPSEAMAYDIAGFSILDTYKPSCMIVISCENANKCARIAENLDKRKK